MSGQTEPVSITLLVGLPGSGKLELAHTLKADLDNVVVINEPRHFTDLTRYPGKDLIIADSYLCLEEVQKNAREVIAMLWPKADPTWIYFENKLSTCMINATGRGSVALAEFLSPKYHIPEKYLDTVVPVRHWQEVQQEKNQSRWRGTPRVPINDNVDEYRRKANFTI